MKQGFEKKLGEKLRIAREYLDLTQEQVANLMKIGRDAIIRIEKGIRKVSTEELISFSKIYNISVEELINDDRQPNYEQQAFARGFENLSENDKKEILDLIKLKNELKNKNSKRVFRLNSRTGS